MEKKRTIKDWIIATRPWSLPAAVTPVLVTTAYLFWQSRVTAVDINWMNAVLSFILLVLLQMAGNLIGDYYDHIKGVDKVDGPNGVTWIFSGLFSPKEILHYGYGILAAAAAVGIVILLNSSLNAAWIGVVGLMLVYCYPWFKGHALGDVDVLLGFALLPAVGVSFVTTGEWHPETMLLSLAYGPITIAILHANNTRDIVNDYEAGLTTLSIVIGKKVSQILYVFLLAIPYAIVGWCVVAGLAPAWSFITFATFPVAMKNCRLMMPSGEGELEIGALDQQTAGLQIMFGGLFTFSFILAAFV